MSFFERFRVKLHTIWLHSTFPFGGFGSGVSIHHTCEISRMASKHVAIGNDVFFGRDVWINIVPDQGSSEPKILLGNGSKIGRRCTISAKNYIELGTDVLLAPAVLVMDHNHEYSNPNLPIHAQGVTDGGRITIGRNCWLGCGSVIFCGKGELTIGRNSVVGANSVVTKSFPPYSVIAGNPAKLIKKYDTDLHRWVQVAEG